MKQQRRAFSVEEVSDLLGVSQRLIRSQIELGCIRSIRLGRRVLIPAVAVDELLRAEKEGRAP